MMAVAVAAVAVVDAANFIATTATFGFSPAHKVASIASSQLKSILNPIL